MGAIKKPIYISPPGESKMEIETKRFNKRALVGSIIIHLFFFLLKLPHLELTHKIHDNPKLIPISMKMITPPAKSTIIKKVVVAAEPEVVKAEKSEKFKNGTDRVVEKAKVLGDKTSKNTEPVQKGDPKSSQKTAYKPGTEVRKSAKTTLGSGSASSAVKSVDNNAGGSGDTYKGVDMTNVTDSIIKRGTGINRLAEKGAKDDGGAGRGHGGGIGDGIGGGSGDGFITGSPNGTANIAKVATNVGSLTGAAKGSINSQKGFDGLATKGSIMVAGVPIEKIALSTIDPEVIRRLLRDNIPQFRSCYQKELDVASAPEGFQGVMNLRFFIGNEGRVQKSAITSDEIPSDGVRKCMKNVLEGIKFPAPRGGRSVEVYQPINLYPKRM